MISVCQEPALKKGKNRGNRTRRNVVMSARTNSPCLGEKGKRKGAGIERCPKCNGNIFFERDESTSIRSQPTEWRGWCLQCGYTLYLSDRQMQKEEVVL
jgi:hypothetical protein